MNTTQDVSNSSVSPSGAMDWSTRDWHRGCCMNICIKHTLNLTLLQTHAGMQPINTPAKLLSPQCVKGSVHTNYNSIWP